MAASRRSTRSSVKITSLVGEFAPTTVVHQPPPVARRFADDQTAAITHVPEISPLYTDLESFTEFQDSRVTHIGGCLRSLDRSLPAAGSEAMALLRRPVNRMGNYACDFGSVARSRHSYQTLKSGLPTRLRRKISQALLSATICRPMAADSSSSTTGVRSTSK
jgi:hypothetical protein